MRKLLIALLLTIPAFAQTPAPPAPRAAAAAPAPATPRPAKATPVPAAAVTPKPPMQPAGETQLFHVVLLRASRTGGDDTEGLPKAAMKALGDLREFLPFKHYRLLDSELVRMGAGGMGQVSMDPYHVRFAHIRKGGKLAITSFTVLPAGAIEQPTPRAGAAGELDRIAPPAIKPLISTSFEMERGETIVVGSSRITGGEALVVLLTAVNSK